MGSRCEKDWSIHLFTLEAVLLGSDSGNMSFIDDIFISEFIGID